MPLDNATIDYMEELLEDYYRTGTPFTSLDIANQTKQAGFFARNRWVAEWLRSNAIRIAHDMGALFNQSLIEVDSKADGHTLAYLYHHMNDDPDDYLDRDQNPISAPTRKAVMPPPAGMGGNTRTAQVVAGMGGKGAFSTDGGGSHVAPDPAVHAQHQRAVSDKTGGTPQRKAVQRDIYGRFTRNPGAPVSKPTHMQRQARDSKGRYI